MKKASNVLLRVGLIVSMNRVNCILLLIISTAVLTVCDFIVLTDTLTYIEYYSVISLNAASVFLVFSVIDVFIFLMAKNYVQTQVS